MFPYHGNISELSAVLVKNRAKMQKVYKEVLGTQFFRILEEADRNLLNDSESFRSMEDLKAMGIGAATNNKFLAAWHTEGAVEFDRLGHFTMPPIEIAPGFLFDQEAFSKTAERYEPWISPYLAPYIHEYNHFAVFALQQAPMILAMGILGSKIRPERLPLRIEDIEMLAVKDGGTMQEMQLSALLGMWSYVIQETYELSTRILDARIYQELGFRVPEQYRAVPPKQYVPFPASFLRLMAVIPVGDVLYGAPLRQRLTILHEWLERLTPSHPIQKHFVESLMNLRVSKVTFSSLRKEE